MTGVRPSLLGGVALVTVGALLFLRTLGLAVPVVPVVLIAVGAVVLVVARRPGTPAEEQPATLALEGASAARVVLNHGAGSLRVGAGAERNRLFVGRFSGGVEQRFPRSNGTFRSPGYEDATVRADIDIEGGIGSFSVR